MKCYYLLELALILLACVARGASECSSSESTSNITAEWYCGEHKPIYVSCDTLSDALAFSANKTATCPHQITILIYLNSDTVKLEASNTQGPYLITNMSRFGLIGASNCSTNVVCSDEAALRFEGHGMGVEIQHVSFQQCGDAIAALSFLDTLDVSLNHVEVTNSSGCGVSFQNVVGQVRVSNSSFTDNEIHKGHGAGVQILTELSSGQSFTANFTRCNFTRNRNLGVGKTKEKIDGGGMYISVKGSTKYIDIQVLSCNFTKNAAKWGSGLFIGFYQNASNSTIVVGETFFQGNYYKNATIDTKNVYNAGGGALATTTGRTSLNIVKFRNCIFLDNSATWGGALALYAAPNKTVENKEVNKYFVINCTFKKNKAALGSAMNVYCKSVTSAPEFCNAIPYIIGFNVFMENGQRISKERHPSASTLDINSFPTHIFSGSHLSFTGNDGTPLCIRTTAVIIENDTTMGFHNNTAEMGGAIALYDSWMSISSGCNFSFTNNTAFAEGGAIYALQSSDLYVPHVHNCFLRFMNNTIPPWDWNCKFSFADNKASTKNNSIYATSVIPCEWTDAPDNATTFCWEDWNYKGSHCTDQITTSLRNFSTTPDSVTVSPGIAKQFVKGVDDLGHQVYNLPITATLWSQRHSNVTVRYNDYGLAVYANRSVKNLTILIQFNGDRNLFKVVSVNIGDCPPGFGFSNDPSCCSCYENMRNVIQCHGRSSYASLANGFCMSYLKINGQKQTVYGRCVFSHAHTNSTKKYIDLPEDENNLDSKFCGVLHRTGLLCGECKKGYSIDVFSTTYNCHKSCSSSAASWIIFTVVNGLPPLVLFLAILVLHIKFTSGVWNAFIFFSHVVTLSQEALVVVAVINMQLKHDRLFLDFLVDFYSFWSLDNYRTFATLSNNYPVCLGEKLRVIDVLALHYISALYPFLLIVIAYIVIELHARNCRVLVWLWKPLCFACTRFRQSWKLQTSVVDAFASFIILSYVKLVRISLLLVTYTSVRRIGEEGLKTVLHVSNYDPTVTYFSRQHLPFIFLGTFFIITVGILPPVLMLFYQCKPVQRCLNHCRLNRIGLQTFMDAFQGCYKDGRNGGEDRRFFAGLYLIFRVVIFLIFNMQTDHTITYYSLVIFCIIIICLLAWLQPYKVKFYNNLDVFFIALLAAFFGLHIVGFFYLETTFTVPHPIVFIGGCLSLMPLLYLVGFGFIKILRRFFHLDQIKRLTVQMVHMNRERPVSMEQAPGKQSVTYSEVNTRQLAECCTLNDNTEKQDLLSRARESGYGSIKTQ